MAAVDAGDPSDAPAPPPDAADGAEPSRGPPRSNGSSNWRSIAAGVVGTLALVGVLASTVAVWARLTLFDSDRVAKAVGNALEQPEVSAALAQRVTEQVFVAIDLNSFLEETLPDRLAPLAPAISAGAADAVEERLTRVFENEDVQQLIENLVRRAHAALMRLLEGDGLTDGISVADGEVTINLLPLIGRGVEAAQSIGLLTGFDLPDLSADGDPEEQIAALEEELDRELREGFGQLVVYRSDSLADAQTSVETAQRAFAAMKRAIWVILAVTAVLLVAAVLLARNRSRAVLMLGLGAVVVATLTRAAVHRVVQDTPELLTEPGARAAVASTLDTLATGLLRLLALALIVGAVVAAVAFIRRDATDQDLPLVAGVLAGAGVVAIFGLTLVTLLLAIAVGFAVPFLLRRLRRPPPSPAVAA